MTVNGEEQVSYEASEKLRHHAVGASGQPVVDVQVLFPPAEEGFDIPAEFINGHDVFGGVIEPVGSQPVCFTLDPVADDTNRFFGLVDAFRTEKHNSVVKDWAARRNGVFMEAGFQRPCLDAEHEVFIFRLPGIEVPITLVVPVDNLGFSRFEDCG